jgi:hypothetical protein
MSTRLRPVDITSYALNELEPRERLYVESMMLSCEDSRRDALDMLEVARLLEEGLRAEVDSIPMVLDAARREEIFSQSLHTEGTWQHVWRASAAVVALASCVVFSVAAPQLWSSAMRPLAQQRQQQQPDDARQGSELESWYTLLQAASVAAFGVLDEAEPVSVPEEFPTRILVPKGTVGMVDMPMPSLGTQDGN